MLKKKKIRRDQGNSSGKKEKVAGEGGTQSGDRASPQVAYDPGGTG